MTDWMLLLIFACVVMQQFFAWMLRRHLPVGSSAYIELFQLTDPFMTGGRSILGLRLKFMFPWVISPDISEFGPAASLFLVLCRACIFFALALLCILPAEILLSLT